MESPLFTYTLRLADNALILGHRLSEWCGHAPLLEEDLEQQRLPKALQGLQDRLFGLTSDAERLAQVRNERRPGSRYASLPQCAYELRQAEQLYRRNNIPFVNSANMSIEEIAATVMQEKALRN